MKPPAPFRDRLIEFLRSLTPEPLALRQKEEAPQELPPARPSVPAADLRERFAAALRRVGGEVADLSGEADARGPLLALLKSLLPGEGAAPRKTPLRAAIDRDPSWEALSRRGKGPVSLPDLAREAGFEVVTLPAGSPEETRAVLSEAALGITMADFAIADTGTVVQLARPFRPRSISLLPPFHLVVLPVERILPSMEDLLEAASAELAGPAGYMTLITGPSRTADIEKVLTIGVHGPGRLAAAVLS